MALPGESQAGSLAMACSKLVNGDKGLTRKCVSHSEFFELKASFVLSCAAFHEDIDVRTRCLKSGANEEILNLCQSAGWTLDGTLTCLRSYPTKELMGSCKKLSKDEEEQIRCVRFGRETAQVESCLQMSQSPKGRLECLEMDIPVYEARRCEKKNKNEAGRFSCLENVVAEREGQYQRDQKELRGRSLASEPR